MRVSMATSHLQHDGSLTCVITMTTCLSCYLPNTFIIIISAATTSTNDDNFVTPFANALAAIVQ